MRLLVSVRDVAEALAAAEAGADFIDLKEPSLGALGGLVPARIVPIVAVLRARWPALAISATVGDLPGGLAAQALHAEARQRVAAVAACGVDYVKVGVAPGQQHLLAALAICDARVVPVLLADAGVDAALVDAALACAGFPALMLDTADKGAGSLLARVPPVALAGFVATLRGRGCLSGLAGALREADVPALRALAPDFVGFRSAVCAVARDGVLEASRVRRLRLLLSDDVALARA